MRAIMRIGGDATGIIIGGVRNQARAEVLSPEFRECIFTY